MPTDDDTCGHGSRPPHPRAQPSETRHTPAFADEELGCAEGGRGVGAVRTHDVPRPRPALGSLTNRQDSPSPDAEDDDDGPQNAAWAARDYSPPARSVETAPYVWKTYGPDNIDEAFGDVCSDAGDDDEWDDEDEEEWADAEELACASSDCDCPLCPPPSPPIYGPFLCIKRLASGSSGEAYMVRDLSAAPTAPGRLLCLKVMQKRALVERSLVRGARAELAAYKRMSQLCSGRLKRAFLMDLEGVLQDARHVYFAMELMHGDILTMMNTDRAYCRASAPRWLAQATFGVSALHAMGIIHRDVKPENFLLDPCGNVRIGDFGSAYVHAAGADTCAAGAVGTWEYMAPEVVRGRAAYGAAVDYWALGCVAYDLESEDPVALFPAREELDRFLGWRKAEHGGQSYLAFAGLSRDAEGLIVGLLRRSPRHRYAIDEVSQHRYFEDRHGVNRFWELADDRLAGCRPVEFPVGYDEGLATDGASVIEPSLVCGVGEEGYGFGEFGWVNPKGVWGGGGGEGEGGN